jgi:ketosteroid isomerase-like protein
MTFERDPLHVVKSYLQAIERGAPMAEIEVFLSPDIVQEEFPNRLVPNGARRDLAGMRDASERGRKAVSAQRYEVLHAVTHGSHVALEVQWTGTLAVPFGSLPVGGVMRARFAVFFEVRDGLIVSQRNYDCFEPF